MHGVFPYLVSPIDADGRIKAGLQIKGYAVGDPVPPQAPLTVDERKAVEQTLAELDAMAPA